MGPSGTALWHWSLIHVAGQSVIKKVFRRAIANLPSRIKDAIVLRHQDTRTDFDTAHPLDLDRVSTLQGEVPSGQRATAIFEGDGGRLLEFQSLGGQACHFDHIFGSYGLGFWS